MQRPSLRFATALLALALVAAACSDSAGDAATDASSTDASSDVSTETTASNSSSDTPSDGAGDESTDGAATDGAATDLVAPGEQFAPVEIVGTALDPMPPQIPVTEADNDSAIGQLAPDLTGTSFDGTPVTITADGTPRVVMFVAHWCPHCQREIPVVKELIDQGAVPDGLEIVVVSTAVREGDPNFPPQDWLEGEGWPGSILRDSADFEALLAFGSGGFPYVVYLDSEHRVVTRSAGEIPADIIQQLWLATAEA